jgi:hypothetical protein
MHDLDKNANRSKINAFQATQCVRATSHPLLLVLKEKDKFSG